VTSASAGPARLLVLAGRGSRARCDCPCWLADLRCCAAGAL